MLKIWGRANSINVQKVLWTCAELELGFERIDAGMQFGVNNTPEYKVMNPNGLVPLIDDGGFLLWESHAIVRYLARRYGSGNILPTDPQQAADVDRWMEWYNTTAWIVMRPIFWGMIRTPEAQRNLAEIEDNRSKLAQYLAIADAHLAKHTFFAGDTFTLADIPLGVLAHRWFVLPITRPELPNLFHWYQRVSARPGFQTHCASALS
jgi:glutathione S-transferase